LSYSRITFKVNFYGRIYTELEAFFSHETEGKVHKKLLGAIALPPKSLNLHNWKQ
jgi:hypothetical protein